MSQKSRITISGFLFFFYSVVSFADWKEDSPLVTQQGILNEPIALELDFSDTSYLLVTASQSYADLSLNLLDTKTSNLLKTVSFPWHKGLDEVLLVHENDCFKCTVELRAQSFADQDSKYSITITPIKSSQTALLSYFKQLNQAGSIQYQAFSSDTKSKQKDLLAKSIDELQAASAIDDSYWRAHALILLAEAQSQLGRVSQSKEILEQIINETNGTESVFRVHALYEFAASVSDVIEKKMLYDEGIAISKKLESERLIAIGINYKAVSLVREAKFGQAIALLEQARDILLETKRWRDLVYPLHNLSWANQRAGNLPASLAVASEQQIFFERYQIEDGVMLSHYNFAMTYGLLGERGTAEKFLDSAIDLHANLPVSSNLSAVMEAFLMKEKALRLLQYGAFNAAEDYAKVMISRLKELNYPGRIADAQFITGEIAFAQGRVKVARNIYTKVIEYDRDNNRHRDRARHLLRLVELEMSQGNFVDASQSINEAMNLLSTTEDHRTLARAFSLAIELQIRLGGITEANDLLEKSKDFITQHSLEKELSTFAYRQALVAHANKDNKLAIEHLDQAILIIEERLPKIKRRDLRQTFLSLQKSVFELNITLMFDGSEKKWHDALLLSEAYRSRTLAEELNILRFDHFNQSTLFEKRQQILSQIENYAASWYSKSSKSNIALKLSDVRSLSESLEKIEVTIANQRTSKHSSTGNTEGLSIPSIATDELVAYYFVGEYDSWLWSITSNGARVSQLPSESVLSKQVANLINQLSMPPGERKQSEWARIKVTKELSHQLLKPLMPDLQNPNIKSITIIPDGPLNNLPFSALQLPESSKPLMTEYSISYAPSLNIKQTLDQRLSSSTEKTWGNILVAADPVLAAEDGIELERLKFSQLEAQHIKKIVGDKADLLINRQASKAQVTKKLKQPYSILHFATHGLLNRTEPLLSGLVFSSDGSGKNLWLASEISRADLLSDLVVLSACESSTGKYLPSEGLLSLSRAFIEGGAGQVIGSLWKVQDQATANLFRHFYQNIFQRNQPVARSLSEAQMAVYNDDNHDWRDPYYWAAFQLQGGGKNKRYAYR